MTGCSKDKGYAVVRDGRLLRMSFSRSLCDHIAGRVAGAEVVAVTLRIGRLLAPG